MTDNIRYSTSHLHEFAAKIQQMSFEGYVLDTRSTFAAKRMGSAYVCWFVATREVVDFSEITVLDSELAKQTLDNPPEANDKLKEVLSTNTHAQAAAKLRELSKDPEKVKQLTIQQKWEIDDEINFEAEEEKKLAEPEDCGKMVYTKQELDAMHWDQLKPLLDEAGIKGRRRQNLIRDFLKKQEENK